MRDKIKNHQHARVCGQFPVCSCLLICCKSMKKIYCYNKIFQNYLCIVVLVLHLQIVLCSLGANERLIFLLEMIIQFPFKCNRVQFSIFICLSFFFRPQQVKERMFCHAIIGTSTGKERIMKVDVSAEFISPLLSFSQRDVNFCVMKVRKFDIFPCEFSRQWYLTIQDKEKPILFDIPGKRH